jgi:hypothetical protein
MVLAIVIAVGVIAWFVSDVLASDSGSNGGYRPKSNGMKLRLSGNEKYDRRLD